MGDTAEELEAFRQKWKQEVTARSKAGSSISAKGPSQSSSSKPHAAGNPYRRAPSPPAPDYAARTNGTDDDAEDHGFHDVEDKDGARRPRGTEGSHQNPRREPGSALEHYERAVEREGDGNLGDSLSHYRQAYRLDAGVDRLYKNKHYPASTSTSKPVDPNPSNAPVTVPNTAHHSLQGPSFSVSELLASFRSLSIPGKEPPTDRSPPPSCPISNIPSEILVNVLSHTAISDPASFVRLAQVCKSFAYLIATEDGIWRRLCLGSEYGFRAMYYNWNLTIAGQPIPMTVADLNDPLQSTSDRPFKQLQLSPVYPSYRDMFHRRPRLRFHGCYISTVNYIRPGAATASQATWNSPVLIVTYYRYLRFFRDGTCVSLLTTTEPPDVVPHLNKENTHTRHAGGLPSAVMNHALRGRWKLSGDPYAEVDPDQEGMLHIETEGADADRPQPKYIYKMMLQLKSAAKAATATRNTKLGWLGFWSYNKLTDDWAEFELKNDRAFFWSRVKSYGNGE